MKKRELIRRWGILFLSFSLITGTASVPSYTVNAAEAGSYETGGGEIAPEPEPDPEPEPEPGGGGDDGGEDNSGTGGGVVTTAAPEQPAEPAAETRREIRQEAIRAVPRRILAEAAILRIQRVQGSLLPRKAIPERHLKWQR